MMPALLRKGLREHSVFKVFRFNFNFLYLIFGKLMVNDVLRVIEHGINSMLKERFIMFIILHFKSNCPEMH